MAHATGAALGHELGGSAFGASLGCQQRLFQRGARCRGMGALVRRGAPLASVVPVATCVKEMRDKLKWLESAERQLQDMTSMGEDVPTIREQIEELKVRSDWRSL